ncbi:hypothetical protein AKO1_013546 [Acrasis kona]|uniref:DOMON domain-containing protein n=1 Tax=Acrasis kona TaxID=1008807 RepID=A0AAW2ZHN6_9EUKA
MDFDFTIPDGDGVGEQSENGFDFLVSLNSCHNQHEHAHLESAINDTGMDRTPLETKVIGNWTLTSFSGDINLQQMDFFVAIRSRDEEEAINYVPESLYSSLVYNMTITMNSTQIPRPSTCRNCSSIAASKVTIVDYGTDERLTSKDGQSIIHLDNKMSDQRARDAVAFTENITTETLETHFKCKLKGVSYHHDKKKFAFLIFVFNFVEWSSSFIVLCKILCFLKLCPQTKNKRQTKKEKRV